MPAQPTPAASPHPARLTRRTMLAAMAAPLALPLTGRPATAQESGSLRVVATFSILADWVGRAGGDRIEVVSIVPAGGDAHTFDPNPEQVGQIAEADVIFEIGAGFEPWLDDMVAASGSDAQRVVISDGLDLIGATGDEEHEGEHADGASPEAAHEDEHEHEADATPEAAHEGEEDHEHGAFDPHVWGDVANAIAGVESIRAALGSADGANAATYDANAATYDANAAAYTAELTELDGYVRAQTGSLPDERRRLVTSHDTFAYYARAYDFEIVGTALNSVTTESGDPSAGDIATLVEQIEEAGVPAIFAENVSNADLMRAIADEAGVTLAPTLYTDALGEPGSPGETYAGMMRYNTDTIVTALGA